MSWVAGVDGCRGGWLVVLRSLVASSPRALIVERLADVLTLPESPDVIAIDMPIGLPKLGSLGGRACDVEARRGLGGRQSAVFAVPARVAVMETEYRRSCAIALANSSPPRMVSKQCFNLFPKIRELDALMTAELQERVIECHPEVAFWAMDGQQALAEPKKVKGRPHEPGLALRRTLLAATGFEPSFLQQKSFRASEAGPDDFLDACACAWTAIRKTRGEAVRFPSSPPERDARGLRMEIWG